MRIVERAQAVWQRSRDPLAHALYVGAGLAGTGITTFVLAVRAEEAVLASLVGIALSVLLVWRRQWPVAIAVAALVGVAIGFAAGPAWLAIFSLSIRRRDRVLWIVVGLTWLTSIVSAQVHGVPVSVGIVLASSSYGAAVAFGAYIGARRDLLQNLRERAERAEAEQALRSDQARLAERARIAQEMHDVLAHKISLVTLQAGGLEVRPDSGPAEVERVAGMIRVTARQALEDLRSVLGVLRGADTDALTDGTELVPQPTLADVVPLVESSRSAGVAITLNWEVPQGVVVPDALGRTMFRVVQEALTNVHKHARDASTRVYVRAVPGHRLDVEVANRRPVSTDLDPLLPGTGAGLAGITERVRLAGGAVWAGPTDDGFLLRATIPWPGPGSADAQPVLSETPSLEARP